MQPYLLRLLSVSLGIFALSACSNELNPSTSIPLISAEEVTLETTENLALSALHEAWLNSTASFQPQAKTYSYTIRTKDIYNRPFVNITVQSPERLDQLGNDAQFIDQVDLSDSSQFHVVVTGATRLHTPISMIETGTGLLQDFQDTLKAMGGVENLKRIVATRSTTFALESKNGQLWDLYLQRPLSDEEFTTYKKEYDELLAGISGQQAEFGEVLEGEWDAVEDGIALAAAFRTQDGGFDSQAMAQSLSAAQTRLESGVFNFRPGSPRIITVNGYAQYPGDFMRPASYNWRLTYCGWGTGVASQKAIGCGPASFAALVTHQYQFNSVAFNRGQLKYSEDGLTPFLNHITHPIGDRQEPLTAFYMKTCSTQGQGLTRADTYAGGMQRFVADQTSQLGVAFQWARGVNIPLTTEKRVQNLRFAKSRNIPAVIEYPAGSLSIHFSIVKEWYKTSSGYYARSTNQYDRVINMGDSLNGETGTFLVYKK